MCKAVGLDCGKKDHDSLSSLSIKTKSYVEKITQSQLKNYIIPYIIVFPANWQWRTNTISHHGIFHLL